MRQDWEVDGEGWKFLDPTGATHHEGEAFVYALPGPDQDWGPWTVHPDPVEPDGEDCGKGRLHVMNGLNAVYAPSAWWPWRAQYSGVIGESPEKVGAIAIRLKRVSKYDFWQMLRGGEGQGAYLRRANLEVANLKGANLKGANLWRANLWRANLRGANLEGADLAKSIGV